MDNSQTKYHLTKYFDMKAHIRKLLLKKFFDDSSKAWMANKVKYQGNIYYKCSYIHSNKKQCEKPVLPNKYATKTIYCKKHNGSKVRSMKFER
jgi:hypothetical protein